MPVLNEGMEAMMRTFLRTAGIHTRVRLITNTEDEEELTEIADIDFIDPTFSGLGVKLTSDQTWPDPSTNGSTETECDGPTLTFESDGGGSLPVDVTGYAVTVENESGVEKLYFVHKLTDVKTFAASGDKLEFKLNFFFDDY